MFPLVQPLRSFPVLVAVLVTATCCVPSASAGVFDNTLVSRGNGLNGPSATTSSGFARVSTDGRYVSFVTQDPFDAIADSGTSSQDLYVRDTQLGTTVLAGRASGAGGLKANGVYDATISGDGRKVVFRTNNDLDPSASGGGHYEVYLRDLDAQTTELISQPSGQGAAVPNGDTSEEAAASSDGRYVCFSSNATNLTPDGTAAGYKVYVRDRQARTTTLVAADASRCSISADGRTVAFISQVANPAAGDPDANADAFVKSLDGGATTLVSRASGTGGDKQNGVVGDSALSADGRHVAFSTSASNLGGPAGIYVRDVTAATTTLASRRDGAAGAADAGSISSLSVSATGRRVAWRTSAALDPADGDLNADGYVRDLADATTILADRAPGAAGAKANGGSLGDIALSPNGGWVVFTSGGTNLSPDDADPLPDVFLRQLTALPAEPAPSGGDGGAQQQTTTATATTTAPPPAAKPAPAPAEPLALSCSGRQLTILELGVAGSKVHLLGLARTALAGSKVTIVANGKKAGTAKVAADGGFSATLPKPKGNGRVRYTASVGKRSSLAFSLQRRFSIVSRRVKGKTVVVIARVTGRSAVGKKVTLSRQVSCKAGRSVTTAKVARSGRFTFALPLPPAGSPVVIYRATAPLGGGTTYTLPIAVGPKG